MSSETSYDFEEARVRLAHRAAEVSPRYEEINQASVQELIAPSVLGDLRGYGRGNRGVHLAAIRALQQTHGNRAAQRVLQRSAQGAAAADEETTAQRIQAAAPAGSRLDLGIQGWLEGGLGADLSGVRVHTHGEADHLARAVGAVAFTSGQDIFFRQGAYNPESSEGRRLLAHEATHTVQQANGPVAGTPAAGGVAVSDPGDSFEQAAERSADSLMAGAAVGTHRAAGSVQRQPAPPEEEEQAVQALRAPGARPPIQREEAPAEEEEQHAAAGVAGPALAAAVGKDEEEPAVQTLRAPGAPATVQREEAPAEEEEQHETAAPQAGAAGAAAHNVEEEPAVQTMRAAGAAVQRTGAAAEEEEEQPVQAMRAAGTAVQRTGAAAEEEEEQPVQAMRAPGATGVLQRVAASEEEQEQEQAVQTMRAGADATAVQRCGGESHAGCACADGAGSTPLPEEPAPGARAAIQRYPVDPNLDCGDVADWLSANSPYAPEWAQTACNFTFHGRIRPRSQPDPSGTGVITTLKGTPQLSVSSSCPVDRPEWSLAARPDRPAVVRAWRNMRAALDGHEQDHRHIGARWRGLLEQRWRGVDLTANGTDRADGEAQVTQQLQDNTQQWQTDAQTAMRAIDPWNGAVLNCP